MEPITTFADPQAAATAHLAAAMALCAVAVTVSAFAVAFVTKELRSWWTSRGHDSG